MVVFLYIVAMILNVGMILTVALQSSKADGFGAGLGGPGGAFRGSRSDEFLAKVTRVVGIGWAVVFLLLAWIVNNSQAPPTGPQGG